MKWEYFCDESYFGLWAVREVGEKRWGHCFHLQSKEEAEGLQKILNGQINKIKEILYPYRVRKESDEGKFLTEGNVDVIDCIKNLVQDYIYLRAKVKELE